MNMNRQGTDRRRWKMNVIKLGIRYNILSYVCVCIDFKLEKETQMAVAITYIMQPICRTNLIT